jgi:hypothetical protein
MFDQHIVKYIKDFLRKCENCSTYDTYVFETNCCITCKKYFCSKCNKTCLVRNYNDFETTSNYCLDCDHKITLTWYRPV